MVLADCGEDTICIGTTKNEAESKTLQLQKCDALTRSGSLLSRDHIDRILQVDKCMVRAQLRRSRARSMRFSLAA
jgi:hypothetical protein